VALGPSWFVNASGITPQRGDTITVETYAVRGTTDGMCVASTYQINQRDLSLRSANSEPLWSQHSYESEGRWYHQPYYRYVTASRLRGMDLQCGGQRCGSVDDVIVNVNGARVDLLSIDPDKNFLGIADTKYLMPWTVVTVGVDNKAHADATKDMILAGVKTPEDLKTINSETVNQVYAAYQVKPPTTSMDRSTGTGLPPAKETRPMTPPAKPEETKPGEKK
jgi:sporulation protein YlmC with PRC-barrel domain